MFKLFHIQAASKLKHYSNSNYHLVTDFKIRDETLGPKLGNMVLETCQTYPETVADTRGA